MNYHKKIISLILIFIFAFAFIFLIQQNRDLKNRIDEIKTNYEKKNNNLREKVFKLMEEKEKFENLYLDLEGKYYD